MASIAHKFVVGDELPKVPYRTLLDYYVDGCFGLQFLVASSAFIVFYVNRYYNPDEQLAKDDHNNYHSVDEKGVDPFPWTLNWILLAVNVSLWLCLAAWVAMENHFVKTDVEHWLNIAEHINAGKSDSATVSVREIQHLTQPRQHWTRDWFNFRKSKNSKFLHIGGTRSATAPQSAGMRGNGQGVERGSSFQGDLIEADAMAEAAVAAGVGYAPANKPASKPASTETPEKKSAFGMKEGGGGSLTSPTGTSSSSSPSKAEVLNKREKGLLQDDGEHEERKRLLGGGWAKTSHVGSKYSSVNS